MKRCRAPAEDDAGSGARPAPPGAKGDDVAGFSFWHGEKDGGNGGMVLNAQLAVDGGTGKVPECKGNVATVDSNPLSPGGSGNGHDGGNAKSSMNVGEAMGKLLESR